MSSRASASVVSLPVLAVASSANSKTGMVSATYVTGSTCPASCPFRGSGCYGEAGHIGRIARRLRRAPSQEPRNVATLEAAMIDNLPALHDLRLHVYGEFADASHAQKVGEAATRYRVRGSVISRNLQVWSYTHRWREIPAAAFGPDINILASVETWSDAAEAFARGYPPAITLPELPSEAPWSQSSEGGSVRVVPCPAQTKGRKCVDCRLCLNTTHLLKSRTAIAFRPNHNNTRRIALETINAVTDEH